MKHVHLPILILSFLILVLACSAISMSAVDRAYRFTWTTLNPWNGVEGIAFTLGRFLHTGKTANCLLTSGLLLVVWWRLYALIRRTFNR